MMLGESEIYKQLVKDNFDTYNAKIKILKSLHGFL